MPLRAAAQCERYRGGLRPEADGRDRDRNRSIMPRPTGNQAQYSRPTSSPRPTMTLVFTTVFIAALLVITYGILPSLGIDPNAGLSFGDRPLLAAVMCVVTLGTIFWLCERHHGRLVRSPNVCQELGRKGVSLAALLVSLGPRISCDDFPSPVRHGLNKTASRSLVCFGSKAVGRERPRVRFRWEPKLIC